MKLQQLLEQEQEQQYIWVCEAMFDESPGALPPFIAIITDIPANVAEDKLKKLLAVSFQEGRPERMFGIGDVIDEDTGEVSNCLSLRVDGAGLTFIFLKKLISDNDWSDYKGVKPEQLSWKQFIGKVQQYFTNNLTGELG